MLLENKVLQRKKSGNFLCPKCTNIIIWACGPGNIGYAYCSRSLYASRIIKTSAPNKGVLRGACKWRGKVYRENKKIIIRYKTNTV